MPTKKRKKQPMVRTRRFANVLDGRRTRTTTTVVSSPPPPGPSLAHCCPARAALAHLRCSRGVFLGHGFAYQIHKITPEFLPEPLESRWAGYSMSRAGRRMKGLVVSLFLSSLSFLLSPLPLLFRLSLGLSPLSPPSPLPFLSLGFVFSGT